MQYLNYNASQCSTVEQDMQKPSLIHPTCSDGDYSDTIIWKKELNDLLFLSIEIYDSLIKVCFRQFKRDTDNNIKPTTYGITMDIYTWYDFYKKLFQFNLIYSTASYVANNNILVLNSNSEMQIQDLHMYALQNIKLSEYQLGLLKEIVPELNESLINFLFMDYLPYIIREEHRFVLKSYKSEHLMMAHLITSIEHDLKNVFKKTFECNGCKIHHINPLNHDCITFTNFEKYQELGHDLLMLVNVDTVISHFLNDIDFVTEDFLYNINVEVIKNILFK